MLLSGLLAVVFSNPQAIRTGTFFLLFASEGAGLDSLIQTIALPAVALGLLLLGMDLYLAQGWHHENWRTAIVAQSLVGSVVGFFCALFVGIVLVNVALWLAIVGVVLAIIGMILSGGANGEASIAPFPRSPSAENSSGLVNAEATRGQPLDGQRHGQGVWLSRQPYLEGGARLNAEP